MNDEITVLEPTREGLLDALATGIAQLSHTELTIISCTLIVSVSAVIAYATSGGHTVSIGRGLLEIT